MRKLHFYLGAFFAPLILILAFTGALQALHWHESEKDGSYTAPEWMEWISTIHTNHLAKRVAYNKPTPASCRGLAPLEEQNCVKEWRQQSYKGSLSKKLFTALLFAVSIALLINAATGLSMAYQQSSRRQVFWLTVGAGTTLTGLLLLGQLFLI